MGGNHYDWRRGTRPLLPRTRLTENDGTYRIGEACPRLLTAAEADREALDRDRVSTVAIRDALSRLDETVDLVTIGSNGRNHHTPRRGRTTPE